MTRTITKEFALVAKDQTVPRNISPTRDLKEYVVSILDKEMGECLEYRHFVKHSKYKDSWSLMYGNEIWQLMQGMPVWVNGTNTIFFKPKPDVPQEWQKDVTHRCIVCDYRKGKAEPNRPRLTVA